MVEIKKENIPECLKSEKKWVGMKVTQNGKKPITPYPTDTQYFASISNPDTWGTFDEVMELLDQGKADVPAYAMTPEDGLIFIDVDNHDGKCSTDEEKNLLQQRAKSLVRTLSTFESYMETSMSGKGVHLLARGVLDDGLAMGQAPIFPVEIYNKKFIAMTGNKLNDYDISDSDKTIGSIRNFRRHYFRPANKVAPVGAAGDRISPQSGEIRSDDEVLRIAMRDKDFEMLWNDRWDEIQVNGEPKYQAQHYADFALISKLTFYTGNVPTQTERLYRSSPTYQAYGKNGKWTKYESDIRNDIKSASEKCTTVYTPKKRPAPSDKIDVGGTPASTEVDVKSGKWYPDFDEISKGLASSDAYKPILRYPLKKYLQDYIEKYRNTQPYYVPRLYIEDPNVNGATRIIQKIGGDNILYSNTFKAYFKWDGQRYRKYGDANVLIYPLTECFGLVEHSVFQYVMTEIYGTAAKQIESEQLDENDAEDKAKIEKYIKFQYAEESKALEYFQASKKFVSTKLAKDVLVKYIGLNMNTDIPTYYQTPYINMRNGVLELANKSIHPFSSEYRQYKVTNCNYDPNATCPIFSEMFSRLIPDAKEGRELQKAFGLCLAKEQLPAKKIVNLLIGPKDSGKTTLLNSITHVLGEYATSVDHSLLMKTNKDTTRGPEMYDFFDTLMITTSEVSEGDRLDSSKVKALTGETVQSIRNNYATTMDKFQMIGLIFIDSNFKPYIPPRDTAAWGRLRLFELPNPVKQKDPTLKEKLKAESSGIFNWLLQGLEMVIQDGEIFETEAMAQRKEIYQKDMDTTSQFLKDCIERTDDSHSAIPTSVLFQTYSDWAKDNNFKPSVRNKFYEEILVDFEKKKSGVEKFYGMKFTELGDLYRRMKEFHPQDFAKKKRMLIESAEPTLPYNVIKSVYYRKSKAWFFSVNPDTNINSFINYVTWCSEHNCVPIGIYDFTEKVKYIQKNLHSKKSLQDILADAEDIWSTKII